MRGSQEWLAIETCRDTTWIESDSTFSIRPNSIQNFGETASLYFYPNPVESLLNIHFSKAISGSLLIRSIDGRILRSTTIKDSELYNIDLSDLSPGIYFIQLNTPDGAATLEKFVKE